MRELKNSKWINMRRRCETPSLQQHVEHDTYVICGNSPTDKHISETNIKDVDQGCDGHLWVCSTTLSHEKSYPFLKKCIYLMSCTFV